MCQDTQILLVMDIKQRLIEEMEKYKKEYSRMTTNTTGYMACYTAVIEILNDILDNDLPILHIGDIDQAEYSLDEIPDLVYDYNI